MKIVLTHTYFISEDEIEKKIMKPYPPLGLLYLSAFLKKNDISVNIYDTTFSTYPELNQYLERESPDILGIHCNLMTKFTVLKLIQYCQENNIISILGGPDASTQLNEFLQNGADIIISGEGEEPLLEVIKTLKKKSKYELYDIPNVSFKTYNDEIISNKVLPSRRHLDDYPFPDRSGIDLHKYLKIWETHHGLRPVSLVTARGCAFTCKWCSHSVYGYTHRRRKPANVIRELKELIREYNPQNLWIADDVFTANKHWLKKYNDLLEENNIHLPYECIGRADRLDEETVGLLKKSGCYRIWFGAESGSQKILDVMSRGVNLEQVRQAVQWCKTYEIECGIFVMFGYPGEEIEDIYSTIEFIRDLQPDQYLTTVAYPLRGTALYEEIGDQIIYHSEWDNHLQRELDIKNRYRRPLYTYAIKKTASEYRKKQLGMSIKNSIKYIYHILRSFYCGYRIKQLAQFRTG
jgi:radical SAM superfamily enzyme YgiQ (UPF0313 family)